MSFLDSIGSFISDNKDLIGLAAGAVAGGIGADSNATATTTNAPWSGLQPYLTGDNTTKAPAWASARPGVSGAWTKWNDRLSTGALGSWMQPSPSMFTSGNGMGYNTMPYSQPIQQPTQDSPVGFGGMFGSVADGGGYDTAPSIDASNMTQEDIETMQNIASALSSVTGIPGLSTALGTAGYLSNDVDLMTSIAAALGLSPAQEAALAQMVNSDLDLGITGLEYGGVLGFGGSDGFGGGLGMGDGIGIGGGQVGGVGDASGIGIGDDAGGIV